MQGTWEDGSFVLASTKDAQIENLRVEIQRLEKENDRMHDALQKIKSWANAYPIECFPEPDFKKANELLKAGGVSMDAISASCMRHVVKGVGELAKAGLEES